jgi:hypothetical protein
MVGWYLGGFLKILILGCLSYYLIGWVFGAFYFKL